MAGAHSVRQGIPMAPLGRFASGALLLIGALPGWAAERDDILALIPPKATAVVQVRGLDRVQDKLDALLKVAMPDKADQASKAVRAAVADVLEGRDPKALRPDGRILIAISDLEKLPDDATLTILFPVQNADDFRGKFLTEDERKTLRKEMDLETVKLEDRPEPFYLVAIPGYMAACSDKETAQKYAKGETGGIARQLSSETAAAFLDADVSMYVNVREVNARYGSQLKTYKSLANVFLKGDAVQGLNKVHVDQLRTVINAAFQVVEDGTAAVLTLQLRPDGFYLKGVAQFAEKSATNGTLKKYKPNPLQQLGMLPLGQAVYSASNLGDGDSNAADLILGGFAPTDDDAAAKETIDAQLRDLARYHRGITLGAGRILSPVGLEIIESNDAAQIAARRLEVLKSLTKSGSFSHVPLKAKPAVRENAEKIGAFSLHAVTFEFDFDKAVSELPEDAKESNRDSMRRAMGGDALNLWFGTDGKVLLQLTAKDWAEAKALVEAYLNGGRTLEKDDAYRSTRKQLAANANLLIVLDAAQTVHALFGQALDSAGPVHGSPIPRREPSGTPTQKPAYVGMALALKPEHATIEVFVPAAAVGQIHKLLQPILDKGQ